MQHPQDLHSRQTQSALSEKTAALDTQSVQLHNQQRYTASSSTKRSPRGSFAAPGLFLLGLLLGLTYLSLYPLFTSPAHDVVQEALPTLFPWLSMLFWTTAFPAVAALLARVSWLDPLSSGRTTQLLLMLVVAWLLNLLAVNIGRRATRSWLSRGREALFFWSIMLLTTLFGLIMFFAPVSNSVTSHDMLLYAFYGRMVVLYHVNPYIVPVSIFPHDSLYSLLTTSNTGAVTSLSPAVSYGPVWLDASLLVTLFAGQSIANILIGFRLIGLLAHLLNALLLWSLLAKLKPEARISGTLLYAWNPLILVLGVAQMHLDIVVALLLLLAVAFFLRDSLILCWVFALLAVLVNILFLPLLLLCLHLINLHLRFIRPAFRLLWYLGMLAITALILALAYAPYWEGWGIEGLRVALVQTFWLQNAINSLDAALLNLPMELPKLVAWAALPTHWMPGVLLIAGTFLLFSLWLANTLDLVLFCASWLLLLLLLLVPTYWPWYLIVPFTLALCAKNRGTTLLTVLLSLGALLCYYWWQLPTIWKGQALITIGVPFLLWGWIEFFSSTWRMTRPTLPPAQKRPRGISNFTRRSRPSWLSRPTWPSRP